MTTEVAVTENVSHARFADATTVAAGWYAIARSRKLKPGTATEVQVGPQAVVVWRAEDGTVTVADAACPHLGGRLADGRITAEGLACPFHAWCWTARGDACGPGAGSGRRLRTYHTVERWGHVWAWLGRDPALPLPATPAGSHAWALPQRAIACHPNLVLANGFDVAHLGPAHGLDLVDSVVEPQAGHLRVGYTATVRPTLRRRLLGVAGRRLDVTFTTVGATMVWAEVRGPVPFQVLFAGRPDVAGHCVSHTVLFLPRRRSAPRVLALLLDLVAADGPILEGLRFRRRFAPSDHGVAAYAKQIDCAEAWTCD